MSNLTLQERIENNRMEKSDPYGQPISKVVRMKFRFDYYVQRNLRWKHDQKTEWIESILIGVSLPEFITEKSEDKEIWVLDGKQRLTTTIAFLNDEWELGEMEEVEKRFEINLKGLKFSQLPIEISRIITEQNFKFIQYEKLTNYQRDLIFKKRNNGTPLSSIELTRSILGGDNLNYFNNLIQSPFMKKVSINLNSEKFVDQELILQSIAVITGRTFDLSSKSMKSFAIDLRSKGLTEEEQFKINAVFKFLSDAFKDINEKTAKKILKKADVIAIIGNAFNHLEMTPETFAGLLTAFISSQPSGSKYSSTKTNKSASKESVKERISILDRVLDGAIKTESKQQEENQTTEDEQENEQEQQTA